MTKAAARRPNSMTPWWVPRGRRATPSERNEMRRHKAEVRAARSGFRLMGFFGWREYERLPDRCAHCGKSGRMTMDHILPVSRGGSHWLHNIQKLCYPCNNAKGNRLEAWTLDRRLILYSDAADLARQLEKVNQ